MNVFDIQLEQIRISPGHNFRGHFGEAPGEHPALTVDHVSCIAGKGIEGDRYFDLMEDYKGQITFFDLAVTDRLSEKIGKTIDPSVVRRNVFLRGVDLNRLIGKVFEIQGVRFSGSEECKPCLWMDEAVEPGTEEFLEGQGGLRARILSSGTLHLGATTLKVEERL
mgnify:CR=1 FL=1